MLKKSVKFQFIELKNDVRIIQESKSISFLLTHFKNDYAILPLNKLSKKYGINLAIINKIARKYYIARKCARHFDHIDYELTENQESIINGSLLGDGHLCKLSGSAKNSRFTENHSYSQKEWVKWKYDNLLPLSINYREFKVNARKNLGNGKIITDIKRKYKACEFRTMAHPIFTKLEKKWYKNRRKIVPKDLVLTPLALAVWFIDDGSNQSQKKEAILFTLAFRKKEVEYLSNQIKNLGINCKTVLYSAPKHDKLKKWYIRIEYDNYFKFIELIKTQIPNLPKSLSYKIDISSYREYMRNTPNYLDCSEFNDELVKNILKDLNDSKSQREIARNYSMDYRSVNRLIHINKHYEKYFLKFREKNVVLNNTSGITGLTYNTIRNSWVGSIKLPSRPHCLCLGYFDDKETAIKVIKKAYKMRDEGISEIKEYKNLKYQYKKGKRRTNKSGTNNVYFNTQSNKWFVGVTLNAKRYVLGKYLHKKDAVILATTTNEMKRIGITDINKFKTVAQQL